MHHSVVSSSFFSFFTDFLSSSSPSVISAMSPRAVVTVVTRLLISPCDCTRADRYFLLLDSELLVILSWTVNLCFSCLISSFWPLIWSSLCDRDFLAFSEEGKQYNIQYSYQVSICNSSESKISSLVEIMIAKI